MKKFLKFLLCILLVAISIGLIWVGTGYKMYQDAIKAMPLEKKISNIKEIPNYTKLEQLPQMYINAVISVEDHRFYQHGGIDIIAIGRAVINDIKAMSFVEGGSTITQQLAKNVYFTQEKKLERKIAEVFMAFDFEKALEKSGILELYLNTSYFGDGYNTVKEASRGYFGKEPKDLTDGECIMLAGIPNAPSVYAPTQNMDLAKQRQKQVALKIVEYGYLTEKQMEDILL